MSNKVDILRDVGDILIKRMSAKKYFYYISVMLVFITLSFFGVFFITKPIKIGNEFFFLMNISFLLTLFFELVMLEVRYRQTAIISIYQIKIFPVAPLKILAFYLRNLIMDMRILNYFPVLVPLILGMIFSGFKVWIIILFTLVTITCFFLFEILLSFLFFIRTLLPKNIDKKISFLVPIFNFLIVIAMLKNITGIDVSLINLPVNFLKSIIIGDFLFSVIFFIIPFSLLALSIFLIIKTSKKIVS